MSSVIARPTTRSKSEVSLSFFSFLFSEVVANALSCTDQHVEDRLHAIGAQVGERILPLFHLRERPFRRETVPASCLQFIASSAWRQLFNHPAEVMATDQVNEFYLVDRSMLLNRYISVSPEAAKERNMVNCASFAAGIIEGMMRIAGFSSTTVEAVYTPSAGMDVTEDPVNVTFVVRIDGQR